MKPTTARLLAAALTVLAGLIALVGVAGPASARQSGVTAGISATAGISPTGGISATAAASATATASRAGPVSASASTHGHPVVIIGIPGLRWTDISATATPALWQLAEHGSVGSLGVTTVETYTCPADAWLTLNSGARAMAPRSAPGSCDRLPALTASLGTSATGTACQVGAAGPPAGAVGTAARVPAMTGRGGIEESNRQFSYSPCWGLLARAAGTGSCAVGPGAALALASPSGDVASYEPRVTPAIRSVVKKCPLTVADLGALPAGGPGGTGKAAVRASAARAAAVRAAERTAGQIIAAVPAGAIIVVAGLGDDNAPHLRAIIVSGPGYGAGLLQAASTRQAGLVLITDLTPSVFYWRGQAIPAQARAYVVGSPIEAAPRGPLPAAIRTLIGQDTAAQVYQGTVGWFYVSYRFGAVIVFGLIALILRGDAPERRRRRRAAYRVAAIIGGSVPAGSFLASLVPWPVLPHPALLLYGVGLACSAVIAAVALAGPWRRDPLGSPGFVGAATIAVIGLDVMTGSHLQLDTPFGLSALNGGRFYGTGNNVVGSYAIGGLLCAAWAASAARRQAGSRGRAAAAAGAITLFTVIAAGWPGFGAKVGGTIAMVPSFLVLLAAISGIRITVRRAAVLAVSGLVLIAVFAVIDYNVPSVGPSDIGAFVGHVLHGGAGSILQRKISTNVGSLTQSWFTPIVPVIVVATGLMLAWPERLRQRTLARAMRVQSLLRPLLTAMWLIGALGWLVNDSGVSVPTAALPFALPLVIAIVTGTAEQDAAGKSDLGANARTLPAAERAG